MASGRQVDVTCECRVLRQVSPKITVEDRARRRLTRLSPLKRTLCHTGERRGWTRTNGFIRVVVGKQETKPVLCFDYVLCTSAPTQGCDRGDRVNDTVSDNNKYSRAVKIREERQGKCVMQGWNASVICLKARRDEVNSMRMAHGRNNNYTGLKRGPQN